ncbi:hypothetical protein [Bacillus sp. JCM 19034]|uniref:hypothetical protein n=1 Tax=Bacillus sp. JCM 19034 TaxID=1481928 RepID=UPI000781B8B5|nr:hypothetical protein [Bacillus sp. JCM 19034]
MDVSSNKKYLVNIELENNVNSRDQRNARKENQRQLIIPKTVEEYRKVLQAEGDRRVTMALETAKAKWEQEYEQRIKKERAEAIKAAQKSVEKERKRYLIKQKLIGKH